ncbi:MAG: hypothetical protein ACRD0M_08815, partial [Acidimicrobiales bacterium]
MAVGVVLATAAALAGVTPAGAAAVEQAVLTADVDQYAYFGGSLAVDGDVAAVGAYLEAGRGTVRLYERANGVWR